ncbi:hypothetical protein [Coleofasciculus sp. H7-2]|uniref:hypothetical protein n=1 Tax=Coleofasciculus sp. H7-2 TaxID=3351545 RepID=UPI00366FF1AC
MSGSAFTVPEKVTFESAIALTQSLLSQMQAGELSEAQIAEVVGKLVKTENGARGFFVTYLTSEGTIADNPSAAVVQALQSNPDTVSELLVKNVAMSAAMAVAHHRNGNEEMAQSSQRVRSRTTRIIELVELPSVYELSQKLLESAVTGEGSYKAFLERWGYDAEQRQVISEALEQIIKR